MTKKKNLTAFMIAIIVMLFSLPANAQGTVGYVVWDRANTLTFKGGTSVPKGDCFYALNTGIDEPAWKSAKNSCTKVKFDASFKDVRPTSCCFWFREFSKLSTIEGIGYLNTANVKYMHAMFYDCSDLTTLDVSKFNTANVEYMDNMFDGCSKLTSLDLSSFNTANVTKMDYMFNGCSDLTTLDVSNFNTDNVKTMQAMFDGCSKLTSLNLSNFNTANVEYMDNMFNDCSGLTTLDVSKFNTANVTKMDYMFNGCSGLTSLDLSSFNTDKVGSMYNMFYDCSGLTSLDLSSFNTAKVTEMDYMFYGCSTLTKIYVSDYFTTDEVSYNSTGMFGDCSQLVGAVSYNSGKTGKDMANFDGYFTPKIITPYVKWDVDTKELTFKVANTKEAGSEVYVLNEGASAPGWLGDVSSDCEKVVFTPSFKQAKPTSCFQWFKGFSKLSTIEGIRYLNTDNVKTMQAMFDGCSGLTTLDVSKFNTANVTHMIFMFSGCSGLTSLDVSKFNTANVEYMYHMFNGCKSLTSLDLSSFNTDKVGLMYNMFNGCSGLTSLDLSSFNTANVTDMGNMFYGCSGLTKIYVSDDFTTDKVSSSTGMFGGCSQLVGAVSYSDSGAKDKSMANYNTGYFTKSNLTPYVKWNGDTKVLTFKVANTKEAGSGVYDLNEGASAPGWLGEVSSNCEKVVFTPSFKQAKPNSCYKWFKGFSKLSTIEGIGYLNTEEVKNMGFMFGDCKDLTSLDLSSFNTAAVTNMESMFNNCSGLTSLDLSSFNTAEVTDMFFMFCGCSGLKTIYVSDAFTTNKVISDGGMFTYCVGLKGATSYNAYKTGIEMAKYTTGYFKTYFTFGDSKVELCGENPLTAESLDLSGDYDFTPKYDFTANTVTYTRDLSSSTSTWFSLCLPFAYTPNNFTAYQLNGATEKAVEIEEITGAIAAGTPVLFKFKDGEEKKIDISVSNADIENDPGMASTTENDCQLYGTYQEKTFSLQDGNTFIIYKDRLMNPATMLQNNNSVTKVGVRPFHAYMTMTSQAGTSAKSFSIGSGDEGTTAIDLLNSVATDDAEYYDINGRRIDAPAKGVNIVRRGNKTMKLIIK